jgi:hypothetical protein
MANNPRSSLYLFLTDKLSGLIVSDTIKVVDRWNNQIEQEKTSGASVLPAVHIQIEDDFEDSTGDYSLQKGYVTVTCHIDIDITKPNGIGTEDWDIIQEVYLALHGEYPTSDDDYDYTALCRKIQKEDNDYSGRYHSKIVFETFLSDCTKGTRQLEESKVGTIDSLNETVTRVDAI